MENLESFGQRVLSAGEMSYEDYQTLRAYREYLDDIEESALVDAPRERDFGRSTGAGFAIVVGHTARRPGATGVDPIVGSEYGWNKDLAEQIRTLAEERGVETRIFFRDGVGVTGAYRAVKDWGGKLVCELHFNAFNGKALGTETLYDGDVNAGSRAWAARLQDAMVGLYGRTGSGDRGLKERDPGDRGYQSVSALDIPSALIEPFFGDNPSEARMAEDNKTALAEAIATAAAEQSTGS